MQTHVFDLEGPYALFRKPYAPVSPVSFPVPPPPTVCGIVGAICGYDRDAYLEEIGWDQVRIAVELREPVKRLRTGINLVNTKEGEFFSTDPNRIQIPHEFLKDVHLRVYVANGREPMMAELGQRLENGTTAYSVSLGLEQCTASVEHVDTVEAQPTQGEIETRTAIPRELADRIDYDGDGQYGHYRVPRRMRPGREVPEYGQIVVEETGTTTTVHANEAHKVGDETVLFL